MNRTSRAPVVYPSELISVSGSFYSAPSVHRSMVDDYPRVSAFEAAIRELVRQFPEDRPPRVLDLGTGTGILAMLAAREGAEVWATEKEGPMFEVTRETLRRNRLDVRLLRYEGQRLDVPPVDVLVSECLGHFAFDEAMVAAVVRSDYLAPNGVYCPSRIALRMAAVSAADVYDHVATWSRPRYGLDLSALQELARERVYVSTITPQQLVTYPEVFQTYELADRVPGLTRLEEEQVRVLEVRHDATVHGLAGWFQATLSPSVALCTGPLDALTHWEQVFLPLPEEIEVLRGDSLVVGLSVTHQGSDTGDRVSFGYSVRHRRQTTELSTCTGRAAV